MAITSYSSAQRIAFAGLVIGFLLCTIGAIAPFWQAGKVTTKDVGKIIPDVGEGKIVNSVVNNLVPEVELVSVYGGLWWWCEDNILTGRSCEMYKLEEGAGRDWAIRITAVVNVFLALTCALAALCRSCCCGGGKTVCHGVIAFVAGAAGVACVAIFASSDGYGMKFFKVDWGWAFFVYAIGSALVVTVSFILCFASPSSPFAGMVISGVSHILPNGYTRMQTDQVGLTQPSEFQNEVVYPQSARY
ncbi:uncharacterized protein LOC131948622 [Physella acuta]|uniref:uncharacterized protein LOC131948622 n=1 Tax=Physella acuta TaxID=109671 RepID=UPI0027DBFC32|nr:uncharacterized protein LOC131948622 [Physella acuta]XP_059166213.1 uncharacterized protein LOC131948622 [Physella acuta]